MIILLKPHQPGNILLDYILRDKSPVSRSSSQSDIQMHPQ